MVSGYVFYDSTISGFNPECYICAYDTSTPTDRWKIVYDQDPFCLPITGHLKRAIIKQAITQEPFKGELEMSRSISLDCCTTASVPCDPNPFNYDYNWGAQAKKKEDNMRNELVINAISAPTAASMDEQKQNYLLGRLSTIYCTKSNGLRKTYGLDDDASPATPKDFIKRIQDGKFILTKRGENFEENEYHDYFDSESMYRYLKWRDPAVKEDKAGFKAAEALMDAAYAKTRDTINIGTAKEGLDAVYAFEAQTFSVN